MVGKGSRLAGAFGLHFGRDEAWGARSRGGRQLLPRQLILSYELRALRLLDRSYTA
jgi:hypothetical protein